MPDCSAAPRVIDLHCFAFLAMDKSPARIRTFLAPTLLLLVAANQFLRAQTEGLTSWKGGGFGMFASLDQQRFAKLYVSRGRQFYPIPLPDDPEIRAAYRVALAVPSKENAEVLAKKLQRLAEHPDDQQIVVAVFETDYRMDSPPQLVARNVHMVSSASGQASRGLTWTW